MTDPSARSDEFRADTVHDKVKSHRQSAVIKDEHGYILQFTPSGEMFCDAWHKVEPDDVDESETDYEDWSEVKLSEVDEGEEDVDGCSSKQETDEPSWTDRQQAEPSVSEVSGSAKDALQYIRDLVEYEVDEALLHAATCNVCLEREKSDLKAKERQETMEQQLRYHDKTSVRSTKPDPKDEQDSLSDVKHASEAQSANIVLYVPVEPFSD